MRAEVLRYKDYVARIDVDIEAKALHGRVLGLRDVLSFYGKTFEELEANFHATIDNYIAWCEEEGVAPEKSWLGKMTFRPSDELRARIAIAAAARGVSINEYLQTELDRATKETLGL
jgi:predicted HicB family RNase H-like nuclease